MNKTVFNWEPTTGRLANQYSTNQSRGTVADLGMTKYTYTTSGQLSSREQLYANRPGAPDDYQCYSYDYASRLSAAWTAAAKNCTNAPTPASGSVAGLGGPAPYAQTYGYTLAGDRSQVKRFDAAGSLAATENYAYPGGPTAPGAFSAQAPFRQMDTRNGTGGFTGPVGPGQTIKVKVTGRGGVPATGVSAVAMNITATAATAGGFITAYAGDTAPNTSNLNYGPGQTVANFAVTPVAADGTVSFTNTSSGTVQIIADTSGYYLAGTPVDPGAFSAQTPYRQMDTRNGTGGFTGPVGPNQTIKVKVTGQGGIPATGVSAVAMNITATAPSASGLITAYAGGTANPNTSNVNYGPGQTVSNFAVTPVGADGTISFTNSSSGTVQIIADTSGYYLSGTPAMAGAFSAQAPFRQIDTRNGTGGFTGPVGPNQTVNLKVTGRGGIPASGVSAVAMNITATAPTSFGFITAYAGGTTNPNTSNVNYGQGQTVPNFAITPVAPDGTVSFTNTSSGTVQIIADTSGYYTAPATGGMPGPHHLQAMTSTAATGQSTTSTFSWDAAGRMTNRSGETLAYTGDGKLATTTGNSNLPANPNPSATGGTPPAPTSGTAGSTGTRYYDAAGNLVGITDGTGTTVTIGSITAHSTPGGVQTATKSYTLAGKTIAQRTAAGGAVKLAFVLSDGVGTTQTIVQASSGATPVTAQTRYTDPIGLARGPTQTAAGTGAFAAAGAGVPGAGSNAANPAGFGAVNGYIGGLNDTVSTLTHLGARDLDPVLGAFTAPDPILDIANPNNYSPYGYANGDPINASDPSGLDAGYDDALGIGAFILIGGLVDWFSTQLSAHPIHMPSIQLPTIQLPTIHWPWEQQSSSGTSDGASAGQPASSYPAIPASADSTISYDTPMVGTIGADDGYVADYPQDTGTYFPAIPQRPSSTNDGAGNAGAALAAANAIMHAASQATTEAISQQNQAAAAAASLALPAALAGGPANTDVYIGARAGMDVYAGITNDLDRRAKQHGDRFNIEAITATPLVRGAARAIEQALIVRNPGFENKINSISPNRPFYQDAVDWGEAWLKGQGL